MISESITTRTQHILKEQLRLFAFNEIPLIAPNILEQCHIKLNKRERLAALLEGDLNFHGEKNGYASHDFHSFAAKFPPQLPRAFIRGLSDPGDVVLDPMMGSGTTLVEAFHEGRKAIGIDIDPLALRLGRAKTMTHNLFDFRDSWNKVIKKANELLFPKGVIEQFLSRFFDDRTKAFVDYWFLPETQRELMALAIAIQEIKDMPSRHFLELTFSSIIVTKSGGVSKARDLAHSRPHLDRLKTPKNALEQFSIRMHKNLKNLEVMVQNNTSACVIAGDARSMPLSNEMVDLIVTSPPYANAIDYMRAHKFSLVWFGKTISELSTLRAEYIGSERTGQIPFVELPDQPEKILQRLQEVDRKKSAILRKYFIEMKIMLSEMFRVLRKNSAAVLVVGTSVMRNMDVQTHSCLADISSSLGFEVVGVSQRTLDRNKRMMPARFGKNSDSMIEQRMHEEFVIGLLKPGSTEIS